MNLTKERSDVLHLIAGHAIAQAQTKRDIDIFSHFELTPLLKQRIVQHLALESSVAFGNSNPDLAEVYAFADNLLSKNRKLVRKLFDDIEFNRAKAAGELDAARVVREVTAGIQLSQHDQHEMESFAYIAFQRTVAKTHKVASIIRSMKRAVVRCPAYSRARSSDMVTTS